MGNQNSTTSNTNRHTLIDEIDNIAIDFISTTHFSDLKNAFDDKYCDKLILLTEKVLSNKFNLLDLTDIHNRIENGKSENSKGKIGYIDKDDISTIENSIDKKEKKMLCRDIASFYIRIFMFYDAILKTINPKYIYSSYTQM